MKWHQRVGEKEIAQLKGRSRLYLISIIVYYYIINTSLDYELKKQRSGDTEV